MESLGYPKLEMFRGLNQIMVTPECLHPFAEFIILGDHSGR